MLGVLGLMAALAGTTAVQAAPSPSPRAVPFKVIVHATHPESTLPPALVADIFLRKVKRWKNGTPIAPVDQWMASESRRGFTRDVLKMSVLAVEHYWRQQIYARREDPPPARGSDADVIAFVRDNPGGIGYILAATEVGEGVKVIRLVD